MATSLTTSMHLINERHLANILFDSTRHIGLAKSFKLTDFCFDEQLEFIQDTSTFKTAVCSRRSGKTIACAADLVDTALMTHGSVNLYITLTRMNAKKIVWPEIKKLNDEFNLGGHINNQELHITFPNKSVIYLSGANDKSEIDNFRGLALKKVYIDESQAFRPYIKELIDDVISKALFDYNGTLCMIGTPGPIPAGYFYEVAHSEYWSHHAWTMLENPHIEKKHGKPVMEIIRNDCSRMGVGMDHPKIQRECFGRWIADPDALVFKYDSTRNHYDRVPETTGWEYIIGVDLGFDDADAIAVIGWSAKLKEAYLVEEHIATKQGITDLAKAVGDRIERYKASRVVADTGGLGKKIVEELRKRYALPIVAAEKSRKAEHIEILNDALRTKKFFAKRESRFAQDCALIEWDHDKSNPDRLVISDAYHSDITDAVLYAFRESLHWLYEPEVIIPKAGTPAWIKEQEREMEEVAIKGLQDDNDQWGDMGWD